MTLHDPELASKALAFALVCVLLVIRRKFMRRPQAQMRYQMKGAPSDKKPNFPSSAY